MIFSLATEAQPITEPIPLIESPTHDQIGPIALATNLSAVQIQGAFSTLASQLNSESVNEKNLAIADSSLSETLTTQNRLDTIIRRVAHDQRGLNRLLKVFNFFSQTPNLKDIDTLTNPQSSTEELEYLRLHNSLHPHAPTSTLLTRLNWYVQGLANQWLHSTKPASQMDEELLARYKDMKLFTGATEDLAEASSRYTNQEYIIKVLSNTLSFLRQPTNHKEDPLIPENPRVLIVGPGNGKVEKHVLSQFNLPTEMIDAIDILPSAELGDRWEEMTLFDQTDILEWAKNPDNHNKYDLVLCVGSTLVNHEDYLKHLEYNLAVQKLLKQNGIYIYETRALEPDPNNNAAALRSSQFISRHPLRPPGQAPSTHPLEHTVEGEFGASMQPWQLQRLLFDIVGFESLNYPLVSPEGEESYFANLVDNDFILNQLRRDPTQHGALTDPVWLANNGNYRITHVLHKIPGFDTTIADVIERLFSPSLEHPLPSHSPLPVATTTS